jgi:hypothetical protein
MHPYAPKEVILWQCLVLLRKEAGLYEVRKTHVGIVAAEEL